jgi:hypothetical protein
LIGLAVVGATGAGTATGAAGLVVAGVWASATSTRSVASPATVATVASVANRDIADIMEHGAALIERSAPSARSTWRGSDPASSLLIAAIPSGHWPDATALTARR